MTFINLISITITIFLLTSGIILTIYFRKRIRNLDGFMGIVSTEEDEENM